MSRYIIKSAPETSRLVLEAPAATLAALLFSGEFEKILDRDDDLLLSAGDDDETLQDAIRERLQGLRTDRVQQIEGEARRITALAEEIPAVLMSKLAQQRSLVDLPRQRDPLARSLWCRCHAADLFRNVERAMRVQHYRDRKKLFVPFDVGLPRALVAEQIDLKHLAEEIAARLHHDEACDVEAVDLPAEDEARRSIMVVITSAGDFSSQKTVENRKLRTLYYRPPNEVVLIYVPAEGKLEACAPDAEVRRLVSEIFADVVLGRDLSGKPLMRKTYDLGRFRTSLHLPIPVEEKEVVSQARLTEFRITLGSWKQLLTLKVTPDDDIHEFAREALGSVSRIRNAGFIAGLEFNIRYMGRASGRVQSFSFRIMGRHSCSLQSEKDPERRELGFRLLEHWEVLKRYRDLSRGELADILGCLLRLYDYPSDEAPGSLFADHKQAPDPLERAGLVSRVGVSDVVLLDDELFGDHLAMAVPFRGGDSHLEPAEGVEGQAMATEDLTRFRINRPLIREKLEEVLAGIPRRGKSREIDGRLAHLGALDLGGDWLPAYLARDLLDHDAFAKVDRLVRLEEASTGGIVFVPCPVPYDFLGTHVVIPLSDLLDQPGVAVIDAQDLQVRYEAARAGAMAGETVTLVSTGPSSAVLTLPGQLPWQIAGAEKVRAVSVLHDAYRKRSGPVRTGDLLAGLGSDSPSQLFRREWSRVKDVYIRSAGYGSWELCA